MLNFVGKTRKIYQIQKVFKMVKGCYPCLPARMPNSHLLISVSFFWQRQNKFFVWLIVQMGDTSYVQSKEFVIIIFFVSMMKDPRPFFCWPLFAISRIFWPHFWGSQETCFIFSQRSKKWPTFLEIGFHSVISWGFH